MDPTDPSYVKQENANILRYLLPFITLFTLPSFAQFSIKELTRKKADALADCNIISAAKIERYPRRSVFSKRLNCNVFSDH